MLGMTVVLFPIACAYFGRRAAVSFLFGCVLSLFNFAALRKTVSGIADRVIGAGRGQSGTVMVLRFLLRYGLVAAAFYAIFRGSALNAYGLTAGLSLPVFAIFVEAGYEIIHAMRGEKISRPELQNPS